MRRPSGPDLHRFMVSRLHILPPVTRITTSIQNQEKQRDGDNKNEYESVEKEEEKEQIGEKSDPETGSSCEKWIVITSISEPTDHVKYLRDALVDWCLVVVGDTKSPADWKYKDTIFLSMQDQEKLGERYKTVSEIPTKSYLRKMVGYLYAIDRGAKYIYETDDDNSAIDGLLGFKYAEYRGLEMSCEPATVFVNPYAYFGQPSVWPRGYPLEMISENAVAFNCSRFTISTEMPLVQQGLVNGDPDVDAIYRFVFAFLSQDPLLSKFIPGLNYVFNSELIRYEFVD